MKKPRPLLLLLQAAAVLEAAAVVVVAAAAVEVAAAAGQHNRHLRRSHGVPPINLCFLAALLPAIVF